MKNSLLRVANLALCIGVTISFTSITNGTSAQKTRCSDVPVTTTIEGTYRIQSDLLGSYQNGIDSVQSVLQCSTDWLLDTSSSPTRSILVDFRDPVANSGATPPFPFQYVPARMIAQAHLTSSTSIGGMHGLNSTLLSPLSVAFAYGGSSYGVRMNPNNWPQTNYALVTCTGVVDPANPATSQCNQWRIEPSVTQPDGERKSIAHLERLPKGRPVSESHGDFYMSFAIDIANP